MLTEQRLNDAINNLIARFSGQRIGFPNGNYYGECTAPIVWLFTDLGIPVPSMFNARADGWGIRFPGELAPYFHDEEFQPGRAYPRGTILMWNSPHIAIVLHSDGSNTVQVFQQNADPNGAACNVTNRIVNNQFHACTYAMVPISQAPKPLYHIEPCDPFKVVVPSGTRKWDLNRRDFADVANNPNLTINTAFDATINATLRTDIPGLTEETYYLEDPSRPEGFNKKDVQEWKPAPPPPPAPPAAPLPVPTATRYEVVTPLPYYANSTIAQNTGKNVGILQPGTYIVYSEEFGCKNLTDDNQKNRNQWINPRENKLPEPVKVEVKPPSPQLPTPTPIAIPKPQPFTPKLPDADKATFTSFTPKRERVTFVMEDNYNFRDLNGYSNKIVLRKLYDEVEMVGTFYHEGREWTRVFVEDSNGELDINRWFACPTINSVTHTPYVTPHDKIYSTQKTIHEQIELKPNAPYTKAIQFGLNVDLLYDKAKKTIDGIFRKKHK